MSKCKKNLALGNVDKLQCDSIASIRFLYTRTMVGKDIGWNSYEYISVQFWSFSYTSFLILLYPYTFILSPLYLVKPPLMNLFQKILFIFSKDFFPIRSFVFYLSYVCDLQVFYGFDVTVLSFLRSSWTTSGRVIY